MGLNSEASDLSSIPFMDFHSGARMRGEGTLWTGEVPFSEDSSIVSQLCFDERCLHCDSLGAIDLRPTEGRDSLGVVTRRLTRGLRARVILSMMSRVTASTWFDEPSG